MWCVQRGFLYKYIPFESMCHSCLFNISDDAVPCGLVRLIDTVLMRKELGGRNCWLVRVIAFVLWTISTSLAFAPILPTLLMCPWGWDYESGHTLWIWSIRSVDVSWAPDLLWNVTSASKSVHNPRWGTGHLCSGSLNSKAHSTSSVGF